MKRSNLFIVAAILLLANLQVSSQNNSENIKSQALQEMKVGRYGEAIDLLNRYISAFPQRADGYNLRGLCNEKRGQYEYAVYDFRSAKKLDTNNKEINDNLNRTIEVWHSLLFNKIEGHKREIALNPSKPLNYLEIGKSYKNLGNWEEAESWYDKYLKLEEASSDEIIRYTEILAKNNHISKGEPILKRYCEKYPDDQRLWSRYGYFSMWLGKTQTAIKAFQNALELKPYFKEALDGLDLARGKGYIYTVNDTTKRFNYGITNQKQSEYLIDKLFKELKLNPDNSAKRISLIDELIKVNRFEEAFQQLLIFGENGADKNSYDSLYAQVSSKRNFYYTSKIDSLQHQYEINPNQKSVVLELAKYFSYRKQLDRSIPMLENYLTEFPNDEDVLYQYALHLEWNNEFMESKQNASKLLDINPSKIEYQLLWSKLSVWMNEDLDIAENYLNNIISYDNNNLDALIALAMLNFQSEDFESFEKYVSSASELAPENSDVINLRSMLVLQKERNDAAALYKKVEEARQLLFEKNCRKAQNLFKEYLSDPKSDKSVYKELADAYLCENNFGKAIDIYDSLLAVEYNYETYKQLAKVLYWSADTINSLIAFKKLAAENPEDAEVKMYLGDSYALNRDFENARLIYSQLQEISPSSELLRQRFAWLGPEGQTGFSVGNLPTYVLVSPQFYYYDDNLGFKINLQGVKIEFGLSSFLSIGGFVSRGALYSDLIRKDISTVKGSAFLKFGKTVSINSSFGKTFVKDYKGLLIAENIINIEKENVYHFSIFFNSMDAALLLYSPFLVDKRLRAANVGLAGKYFGSSGLRLSAKYNYLFVAEGIKNSGNSFEIRIGKEFQDNLTGGYEYYYYNFENASAYYWSPAGFESHSLWADINFYKDEETSLAVGGKVGLIPNISYILREIYGEFDFKLIKNLTLKSRITGSSSAQQSLGYSSYSITASLFWLL